jgi:serine/threonine protein kinase
VHIPDRWRQVEDIVLGAADLPPEQRDAFLRRRCGEDTELRREAESLLAYDREEGAAIAGAIGGAAALLLDGPSPEGSVEGAVLGNYRIVREVGRGGMGAVYLAERSDRSFEKQVAIKLVRRGVDNNAVLRRFEYERRILAALDYPYIARLLDGGTSPDGRPYFVMEYVNGKPLDVYCHEHGLTLEECCRLFRKICEAVSYAHRNLVIHRDLKPGNILVTGGGVPKLLDFGIARLVSTELGSNTLTGPFGLHPFTPDYASPEQLRGDAVTTATDVYSLGATLRAILEPPECLPSELGTIIGKATRPEPEQRFASVTDLSEDVRRYLEGLPILAREQTLWYRTQKFVKRHRAAVAAAAALALVLIAGIAAIVRESHDAELGRRQADQRLSQAVELANRTLAEVNDSISQAPGTIEARRQIVHHTMEYLDRLAHDSNNDPRVLAALTTAYLRVGDVLGNPDFPNLGDLGGSLQTYQKALDLIASQLVKAPNSARLLDLVAQAHQARGRVLEYLNRIQEADNEYRQALSAAELLFATDKNDSLYQLRLLDAHHHFDWLWHRQRPRETEEDARKMLPLAEKLAAAQPGNFQVQLALANFYSMLGASVSGNGVETGRLNYYQKAVAVRERIYRDHPHNPLVQRDLMIAYGHVADTLGNPFLGSLGDYRGALAYYRKAAAIAAEMSEADPLDRRARYDVGVVWTRIAAALDASGDARQASLVLDRSLAQLEPLLRVNPDNIEYTHALMLAWEYRGKEATELDDARAALTWYRRSLDLAVRALAAQPGDATARAGRVAVEGPIAVLLSLKGDQAAAIEMADQSVRDAGGLSPAWTARAWSWRGQVYDNLQDWRTAASDYEHSLGVWKATSNHTAQSEAEIKGTERRLAACRRKIAGL